MNTIQNSIRTAAISETLRALHNPNLGNRLLEEIKSLPPDFVKLMAIKDGIPDHHFETYCQNLRGEPNRFLDGVATHNNLLQPGDVVLMNGNALLQNSQKAIYPKARSSHVALVHADYICVDAMPNPLNVSNRLISEVLSNCKPDWRVMRLKTITPRKQKQIHLACSYYLGQPYAIKMSTKALPEHAYCSELIRKIYERAKINNHGIYNGRIVAPAHFDKLLDYGKYWNDITEDVKPAIEFCQEYEAIAKSAFRLFIEGFKLNRQRFKERDQLKIGIENLLKNKSISSNKAKEMLNVVENIETRVNHRFWDFDNK